ncbi:MAG TPA: phage portal protein, partial [Lachnospiraceae bacterium]|nr:phage portal protein [Lachnospiraceae bacterium]
MDADSKILTARLHILDKLMLSDSDTEVTNSGYSHGGASRRRTWAKGYHSESGSAKRDIEENRKLLRERSRDLAMNAPLATGAVKSSRTSCIGPGLVPKPKIDYEFLGLSQEEANELQRIIKKEFAVWAESTICDNNDQNNFYELQQIAFIDWLKNGEEFVLIKYDKPLPYMPYQLRLKLVEADRVCTKGSLDGEYDGYDRKGANGNTVVNGVEIDKSGKVVAYHIASRFPGEYGINKLEWKRVEKRGKKTGNPNILHIFNGERADQYRGVPFLAPVIQTIKQLTRYTEAEIMAAVINSMFTIFITTQTGNDMGGFAGADEEESEEDSPDDGENGDDEIKVGSGVVNFLKDGEGVEAIESTHPSSNYDAFVTSMAVQIGA